MYLKRTPNKSGRVSLSAVQAYRDESGKKRQRTVETFGFVDELEREFADPVAHFREVVAAMDAARLAEEATATIAIHPRQRVDKRESARLRRHVGDALACWWLDELGVETAVRNGMRGRRAGYDLNAVLRLLVCERLLEPGSKLAAWERRDRHFFRTEFTDDDVYRALDEVDRLSDRIVGACNRSVAANAGRDESLVYYDVTNYFFECDPDDGGLRRKGVSKEHRPNPIVQMGLLQDSEAIPIGYDLFAGNTNDCETLLPVLKRRKERGLGRVVVVADKGMNCSDNIAGIVAGGDGFVFSQSIRGTRSTSELREWALSDEGYEASPDGEFKIKSSQRYKRVHIKDVDAFDGEAKDVDVEVKVVAMWSRKYAERARHERDKVLEKSRQLVADPGAYTRATHYGATRFVRGVTFDRGTGEVLEEAGVKPQVDQDAVDEAARLDGYYLIVTSETDWEDSRVLDAYRGPRLQARVGVDRGAHPRALPDLLPGPSHSAPLPARAAVAPLGAGPAGRHARPRLLLRGRRLVALRPQDRPHGRDLRPRGRGGASQVDEDGRHKGAVQEGEEDPLEVAARRCAARKHSRQ